MSGRVIVVGSVNVDLVIRGERLPLAGRDGGRRDVRAAPRRQGRQPGRGRGPARTAGPLRRRGRRRRLRRSRRARPSPRKGSTPRSWRRSRARRPGSPSSSWTWAARTSSRSPRARTPRSSRVSSSRPSTGSASTPATSCSSATSFRPPPCARPCGPVGRPAPGRSSTPPRPTASTGRCWRRPTSSPRTGASSWSSPRPRPAGPAGRRRRAPRPPTSPVRRAGCSSGRRTDPGVGEAVIVTLGSSGALIVAAGSPIDIPPLVVEAIDTTGAGDAFNGALAVAIAEDRPLARGGPAGGHRRCARHHEGRRPRGDADRGRARRRPR